jgi:hypothetical protein
MENSVEKSESIGNLAAALVAAQSEFPNIKKDSENPFFKSTYADLAAVVAGVKPILAKHGLSVLQVGGTGPMGTPVMKTFLIHKSGEFIGGHLPLNPTKPDPQGFGSAITYMRRYGLQAILGVAAEDDDGHHSSDHSKEHRPPSVPSNDLPISEPQQKRLFAISYKNGWTSDEVKRIVQGRLKCDVSKIPTSKYPAVVEYFEKNSPDYEVGNIGP